MKKNFYRIDEQLESTAQRSVAKIVSSIPDEPPSLAWRTQLNEALRMETKTDIQGVSVADVVRCLPDEQPSMLWRSQLNESIRSQAHRIERRRKIVWFARPVAGLGLALAVACVILVRPLISSRLPGNSVGLSVLGNSNLEAGLVSLHREEVRSTDVAGSGLSPHEAASLASQPTLTPGSEESEADLEF